MFIMAMTINLQWYSKGAYEERTTKENIRSTFTDNQKPAFDSIAKGPGKVRVTMKNSQGGRNMMEMKKDQLVGVEVTVDPTINLYVNSPNGIFKRKWP